jgi:hypothetical protein
LIEPGPFRNAENFNCSIPLYHHSHYRVVLLFVVWSQKKPANRDQLMHK